MNQHLDDSRLQADIQYLEDALSEVIREQEGGELFHLIEEFENACKRITGYSDDMLYTDHSRTFAKNKYVYPVLSRRSRGISVGINLTPDRVCNFDCVYCQVDRTTYIPHVKVDIKRISPELRETLESVISGRLFTISPFDNTPIELRHLSDIALSGDAEPTTFKNFYEVVEEIIRVKQLETKLVLITNASCLNRLRVQDAIDLMYRYNGEVWAKLDAGRG